LNRTCVVDPVDDPRWSDLVERSPDASIFHHPLWLRLVRDTYRYPMFAVCVSDAAGKLSNGLPIATIRSRLTGSRLVSVPFSDVCAPIGRERQQQHEGELLAEVDSVRRRLGLALEIHGEVPLLAESGSSERFYHHVVALDGGIDSVLARVTKTKRSGAKRARREGVTAVQRRDAQAIDAFFRLHVLTRRKLGSPTQPQRFFRGLGELFDRGMGFVLLLEWQHRPIAAGLYLRHGHTLTYKYSASDPGHLDKCPNDLMNLEALRIACEIGCTRLDLGRTELDNDGLRRFKLRLGADERELTYTMTPAPKGQASVRSVSPLQQALIRRSPPVVGRLLGAAVYRHFG
jgi:CelD/BcsL family acetyltransferase involved in cellulose biosynthesis